jgi:hypothetical protein
VFGFPTGHPSWLDVDVQILRSAAPWRTFRSHKGDGEGAQDRDQARVGEGEQPGAADPSFHPVGGLRPERLLSPDVVEEFGGTARGEGSTRGGR